MNFKDGHAPVINLLGGQTLGLNMRSDAVSIFQFLEYSGANLESHKAKFGAGCEDDNPSIEGEFSFHQWQMVSPLHSANVTSRIGHNLLPLRILLWTLNRSLSLVGCRGKRCTNIQSINSNS